MTNRAVTLLLLPLFMVCFSSDFLFAGEISPEKGCKDNPQIVDRCFTLHGRISITNGTPSVRIWQVSTKQMLGVVPSENEIMPDDIKKNLTIGTQIYGDFLLCPFTNAKTGEMQFVCIESVSNLVIEQYEEGKGKPKVFKLKDKKAKE
jgi:hypothetical protein